MMAAFEKRIKLGSYPLKNHSSDTIFILFLIYLHKVKN
jgi:hypothetical protein